MFLSQCLKQELDNIVQAVPFVSLFGSFQCSMDTITIIINPWRETCAKFCTQLLALVYYILI